MTLFKCYLWETSEMGRRRTRRGNGGISRDKRPWKEVLGRWYSMWQTPGTHASSTFHGAHSLDAGLPRCPCPPPSSALCARIISQQRRRCRWSHPREGSHIPLHPPSSIMVFLSLCLSLSFHPGCLHPLFLQPPAWQHKETPLWQR